MNELRLPVRDRATKPFRDALKGKGLKLVEVRRYAVVRKDDGAEVCSGTLNDVRIWAARQMREGEL
jgi:hypothetical protein